MDKIVFDALVKLEKQEHLSSKERNILSFFGYITDNHINQKGLETLEPYKVKRAVIMAAGFGSRMVPATLTYPKPMIKVNGVRLIDTLIEKLLKVGITDITIVRGYLKEKFDELKKDYPFIKFVDNDLYVKENNISSAILVCNLLRNAYLCEADFLVTGDDIINKYEYETSYMGSKVEKTDDWCFDVINDRLVNYRKGGTNCINAYGISYWSEIDGKHLDKRLHDMYKDVNNHQMFWEMCIFDLFKDEFDIKPRYVNKSSIVEIDSYEELKQLDSSYK